MALYTGKGDKGDTGYFGSKERVSKASARPEALGACDEINSLLGVCKVKASESALVVKEGNLSAEKVIDEVQQTLFIIQSELAGAEKTVPEEKVRIVERVIDSAEKELPEIKTFRVAGGTELSALLDYARAVSRRAERRVLAAIEAGEVALGEHSRQYLNRLSSLLYALARLANAKSGINEESPTYE